jgi:hypothetical protein
MKQSKPKPNARGEGILMRRESRWKGKAGESDE